MRMIFYRPVPIDRNSSSASGIRPYKMLDAFRSIGYEVDEVCGFSKQRKVAIERIKENVKNGVKYDFAYGEDTTLPFAFNDPLHIPFHPIMDYLFWNWLRKNKIPFGCFYRDCYWRFHEFRKGVPVHKWFLPLPFHYLDVFLLKKLAAKLFLPSEGCASLLPYNLDKEHCCAALPPGCDSIQITNTISKDRGKTLEFFYVGGILPPNYDLSEMLYFFTTTDLNVHLTLCCREEELHRYKKMHTKIDLKVCMNRISIVHGHGNEILKYWQNADIFIALWKNVSYHHYAMPVKIIEAIGHCLPIITTIDNAAADFVLENNLGWCIRNSENELGALISQLISAPQTLSRARSNVLFMRDRSTWKARTMQVKYFLVSNNKE